MSDATDPAAGPLRVWIDQDKCTGDGLCVQYARDVFEFDVDGLAYVKDAAGELRTAPGERTDVPAHLRLDVIDAALECPGNCIHVERAVDAPADPAEAGQWVEVAGPDATTVRARGVSGVRAGGR